MGTDGLSADLPRTELPQTDPPELAQDGPRRRRPGLRACAMAAATVLLCSGLADSPRRAPALGRGPDGPTPSSAPSSEPPSPHSPPPPPSGAARSPVVGGAALPVPPVPGLPGQAAPRPWGPASGKIPLMPGQPGMGKGAPYGRVEGAALDLSGALRGLTSPEDGGGTRPGVSVAVLDATTGVGGVFGDEVFDTASIVKVDILVALLLRAEAAGRGMTAQERRLAAEMIEESDNEAASVLWRRIGWGPGLDAANRRLGLTGTHGGPSVYWGLTRTTASDQLALLRAVFGSPSPLTPVARRFVQHLMARVVPEQAWGVSAAADHGARGGLKNGWLRRTATGRWDINSIGRVESGGHTLLVAVLSRGNDSEEGGIDLVQRAARSAVQAVIAGGGA